MNNDKRERKDEKEKQRVKNEKEKLRLQEVQTNMMAHFQQQQRKLEHSKEGNDQCQ